jgi:hypothetical protein
VNYALPGAIGAFVAGLSNTVSGGVPLPIAIPGTGSPGCFQLVSLDATLPVVIDALGRAANPFSIPATLSLIGTHVFEQFVVFDSGAPGGIVTSAAPDLVVGDVNLVY